MRDPLVTPIEKIQNPVMFINGDHDGLFSISYMQSLFDRLSMNAKQFSILKNSAHFIFQEHSQDALELIVPF